MKPTRITGPPHKEPVGYNNRNVLVWPADNGKHYTAQDISRLTGFVTSAIFNLLRGDRWQSFEFRAPLSRTECGKRSRVFLDKKVSREQYTVSHSQAVSLVEAMIDDAKGNIKNLSGKKNLDNNQQSWLDESKRFLCNHGGGLESLLACIKGFDTERALEELRNYALNGYKNSIHG